MATTTLAIGRQGGYLCGVERSCESGIDWKGTGWMRVQNKEDREEGREDHQPCDRRRRSDDLRECLLGSEEDVGGATLCCPSAVCTWQGSAALYADVEHYIQYQ